MGAIGCDLLLDYQVGGVDEFEHCTFKQETVATVFGRLLAHLSSLDSPGLPLVLPTQHLFLCMPTTNLTPFRMITTASHLSV